MLYDVGTYFSAFSFIIVFVVHLNIPFYLCTHSSHLLKKLLKISAEIGALMCKWRYIDKYAVCGMVRGRCCPMNGVNDDFIIRKPRTCLLSRFRIFELYLMHSAPSLCITLSVHGTLLLHFVHQVP